jgi:hypothetical protein
VTFFSISAGLDFTRARRPASVQAAPARRKKNAAGRPHPGRWGVERRHLDAHELAGVEEARRGTARRAVTV